MFILIKQVLLSFVLLSFSGFSRTKWLALNNEPCMTRPTIIYLNNLIIIHSWLV